MSTLLSFILAISILVVIHEFGHFWVARRCGVKVLRFSVGFGKPLWSYTDKLGTEYSLAPIPLGGYVKMLDEREGPVKPEELHQAFNQKTVWQRIAIASAGPIANFIFAVAAYWSLFMMGIAGQTPIIGKVEIDSPAYEQGIEVGDRVQAIADVQVSSFEQVSWQLISYIGETVDIELTIVDSNNQARSVTIPVKNWLTDQEAPNPLKALGIQRQVLPLKPIVGEVVPDGAASQAGLLKGDRVLSVNAKPVEDWREWVELVRERPLEPMLLFIEREGNQLELELIPAKKSIEGGESIGFVGVGLHPDAIPETPKEWLTEIKLGPLDSLIQGVAKTKQLIVFTLDSLWKMILGDVSVKNLSGPITIAKVADTSVSNGIQAFISFLALLSVSLGVLNLLPIPVLDGGHILFYAIEAVRGKALSERTQIMAVQVGMVLLLGLMVIAFYNDISRL